MCTQIINAVEKYSWPARLLFNARAYDLRMNPPVKTVERYLCQHCGHYLTKKTFRDHRRLFFSPAKKQWIQSKEDSQNYGSDDNLPSLPESESCSSDDDMIQENVPKSSLSSDSLEELFMERDVDPEEQQLCEQGVY